MVIGGFVVQCLPEDQVSSVERLAALPGIELYGPDEKGNIVAVVEADSSDDLQDVVKKMEKVDGVLNVGMTYMNMEDEAKKIAAGEETPDVFRGRKRKRNSFEAS